MNSPHLEIGDMSAGQESGSPIRENRTLLPAPLPPHEARGTLAAAAGVSTVGLRPPFDTPQRHSHPVCRAILTLIVALDSAFCTTPRNDWKRELPSAGTFGCRHEPTWYPMYRMERPSFICFLFIEKPSVGNRGAGDLATARPRSDTLLLRATSDFGRTL